MGGDKDSHIDIVMFVLSCHKTGKHENTLLVKNWFFFVILYVQESFDPAPMSTSQGF